jgi:hypothetical protein
MAAAGNQFGGRPGENCSSGLRSIDAESIINVTQAHPRPHLKSDIVIGTTSASASSRGIARDVLVIVEGGQS